MGVGGWVEGVEAGWAGAAVGVEQHDPVRAAAGEAGEEVGDQVAFGVDEHDPAAGVGVVEDQLGEQGGFPGAGGADHVQVMPRIGDAQADGAGGLGVGDPERFHPGPGGGDARWRGEGAGAGAFEPGHERVHREVGEGGELGHRQQVTAPEPAPGQRLGGVAQAGALVAVVPGVGGERRGERVRPAPPAGQRRRTRAFRSAGPLLGGGEVGEQGVADARSRTARPAAWSTEARLSAAFASAVCGSAGPRRSGGGWGGR